MAIVVICVELRINHQRLERWGLRADLGFDPVTVAIHLHPCGNSGLKYLHFCLDQNKPTTITTIIITSSSISFILNLNVRTTTAKRI
jgi:hypothetical protein